MPAFAPNLRVAYPPELPISSRVGDILAALEESQVVIVVGATGSGKTTQLPKIVLQMGRGAEQQIGVTQPRRIAATTVAARVASELECELGSVVGYQIRFADRTSDGTRVKFMTDGILLAETQRDPLLRRYDTIVIDEAHERSLNIDFLLGWLKRVLPKRRDLRVIVSSATIEADRFSAFFDGAPVIQVEGRTFPVDVLYEPLAPEVDLPEGVADAIASVTSLDPRGDVLVFLPGEREIRETEQALGRKELRHTVVVPLYARLAAVDQAKAFASIPERRIILATNVAETSLTIPGIVYVVDSGLARVTRYDPATGTTRLQIEPISQASADQRKGRCGRVRDGICVRLFEESSFTARPAFTDPEMKRTGLAGVILRMKSLGLGNVEDFPFLDPPHGGAITEGYRVLQELGALDGERELTPRGRRLARLPVDPRLGRMILAGAERGCLHEILVLAAGLSIQDPRERPRGQEAKADQRHQAFRCEQSDFVGLLRMWDFIQESSKGGRARLKRACKEQFLSFTRVREWLELHRQLTGVVRDLRLDPAGGRARKPRAQHAGGAKGAEGAPGRGGAMQGVRGSDALHRALLAGLLSRVGQWSPEPRMYIGARQTRFVLHPSSALAKKPPAWVMAFELVQTTRLFARTAAKLEPAWFDEVAGHLLKRSYSDPHWSERAGRAKVKERATLYGLPVFRDRRVDYATVNPPEARRMFLCHALVRGEYSSPGAFQRDNKRLLEELAHLRDKARQSEMLADEERMLAFFEQRVSEDVVSGKTFEAWRERAELGRPDLLVLSPADVLADAQQLRPEDYPDVIAVRGVALKATYRFEPAAEDDGVSLEVPLALLPQVAGGELDWTIPAWQTTKILALLRELPRGLRRGLEDVTELAAQVSARLVPFSGPLLRALSDALFEAAGTEVPPEAWRLEAIPPHLSFFFRVKGERGEVLGQGRDVRLLLRQHGPAARELLRRTPPPPEWDRRGMTSWDFQRFPPFVVRSIQGIQLRTYPALVDRGDTVDLLLLETDTAARATHRSGVARLLRLAVRPQIASFEKRLPAGLEEVLSTRVIEEAFGLRGTAELPRSRHDFEAVRSEGERRLGAICELVLRALSNLSVERDQTQRALEKSARQASGAAAREEERAHLGELLAPEVLAAIDLERLARYPIYLRAVRIRLERAALDPRKDARKAEPLTHVWNAFAVKRARARDERSVETLRWALEELRVAIFAPELVPGSSVALSTVAAAVEGLQ